MTPHGFIADADNALKKYKDAHTKEWSKILGGDNFDVIEEDAPEIGMTTFTDEPE